MRQWRNQPRLNTYRKDNQRLREEVRELREENDRLRNGPPKPESPSNDDIVESFFTAKDYAKSTERPYRLNVKYLRQYLDDMPLDTVTESDVIDFANNWGTRGESVTPTTMEAYLKRIKRLFDWMIEQDWGPDENVVARAIDRFKQQNRGQLRRSGQNAGTVLEPHEYVALLKWNRTPRTYALLMLAAKTGLRRKELARLKVQDIDLDEKKVYNRSPKGVGDVRLPKSDADQKFIDDETVEVLETWLKQRSEITERRTGWLFPNDGDHVSDMTITRWWNKATERAVRGLGDDDADLAEKIKDFTPHDARRCFTTWLNKYGCPRDVVSALRGDADGDMVALYTQYGEDTMREEYENAMPSIAL
jgi:integrase